ncbi:hypothetical protein [uncultured Jatrophihabitans sp.]|uniref:hypothetical protein n=1 Tax=uncultured Jatrophihabitans sp. TaxID=1610747 RepID=UPI0035C985BB
MTVDDDHEGPRPDTGLVVRVWREPEDPSRVRARMLAFHGLDEPSSSTIAADEQQLVDAVSRWVRAQLGSTATHDRPSG